MDIKKIESLLNDLKNGRTSIEKALNTLKHLPYGDMDFAKIDHHRGIRNGIPEVIFAKNKKTEDVVAIANAMLKKSGRFLITKASEEIYRALNIKKARFYL